MKTEKVLLFDLEGNFLEKFESMQDCADKITCRASDISAACLGRVLTVANFQVRKFYERSAHKIGDVTGVRAKTVIVSKYWGKKLICVYASILEAAEKNSVNAGHISQSIKKGIKCNGFTFKEIS